MKENLLHFIWSMKLFTTVNLTSSLGKSIKVYKSGDPNKNSGPDFLNAKIQIDNQLWAGNVEIHVNSSDWYVHNHEKDTNYDAVILHVVWNDDVSVFRKNNEEIPTLELKKYIHENVLISYNQLYQKNKNWINCEKDILKVDSFTLLHWKERLYFERLEQKTELVKEVLTKTTNNWEATLFILLAKNFGLKVNADAFFDLASSFDFSVLRKSSVSLLQLEALFYGQACMLNEDTESDYYKNLKGEYEFLKHKFNLIPIVSNQVQYFRLRPINFPTLRLSQLAMLYYLNKNLFSRIMEAKSIDDFYKIFVVVTSEFWNTHYTFSKESKKSFKKISKPFVNLLLINTIIPILFMYSKSQGETDNSFILKILEEIKPENNSVVSKFKDLKIEIKNAFDSQALIQLKNEYCNKQQCLKCEIGKDLLKG
jgi:hypothetical protein